MSADDLLTRAEEILSQALQRAPDRQDLFLDLACGDDAVLRREVESLLAATREMGEGFLETPVLSLDDDSPERGITSIGAYRLVRQIGRGGMGKVYLAVRDDGVFHREVAVKVLKRGLDTDEIVRRFRRERHLLGRLEHPNIVRILDGGTTGGGLPYFVMERVEGEPVDRYCAAHRLSVPERLRLFRKICAAVEFAHQRLIVHRDLKPQNVLVDRRGEPKLLDFGIAKLLDPERSPLTMAGVRPMTPAYASPEQLSGGPITTASDVFSLGLLLFTLLTDRRPEIVATADAPSTAEGRAVPEPVPPSRVTDRRGLTGDLDSIVLHALERDPQHRYASVEQLSEDLLRHLRGRPVRARPSTPLYHLRKFVRRNRAHVAVTVILTAGLLGFAVSMALLRNQAELQRNRAQLLQERAEHERQRAEEVTRFLITLFRNPNPEVSKGEAITARQLLEESAETIRRDLGKSPDLRADLMSAMGEAYLGLALYEAAAPLLEESLRLRRASATTRTEDLAASLFQLADLRRATDRDAEAIDLVRQALQILRRADLEDPAIARALNNQALLIKQQGDLRTAEQLYRTSLKMKIRLHGLDHGDVATTQHNLAAVLRERGLYEEAARLYRESLALKIRLNGEDSPETARTLNGLALLLTERGEPQAAEPLMRQALDLRRAIYGSHHPAVAHALLNLGFVLRYRGLLDEAAKHYEEAAAILSKSGFTRSSHAALLRHEAALRLQRGEPEAAAAVARRAVDLHRQAFPAGHWRIAEAESVLGACLLASGHREEARSLLERSLRVLEVEAGTSSRPAREARASLELLEEIDR